jgi:hypothetical protein
MVGGKIIEVRRDDIGLRLWCMDVFDECAIYVQPNADDEDNPKAGDSLWWQMDKAYWTPASGWVKDHPMQRIGNSFEVRPPQ